MEVCGHLWTPDSLALENEALVPIGYEARWVSLQPRNIFWLIHMGM
jgi:hypothetical protein